MGLTEQRTGLQVDDVSVGAIGTCAAVAVRPSWDPILLQRNVTTHVFNIVQELGWVHKAFLLRNFVAEQRLKRVFIFTLLLKF